jgi:hypothetical protein
MKEMWLMKKEVFEVGRVSSQDFAGERLQFGG